MQHLYQWSFWNLNNLLEKDSVSRNMQGYLSYVSPVDNCYESIISQEVGYLEI